jgi:hypothetical protein
MTGARRRTVAVVALFSLGSGGSLSATGVRGAVHVNPLEVGVMLTRGTAATGTSFNVRAEIANHGSHDLNGARATLRLDQTAFVVDGSASLDLRAIRSGKQERVQWRVCPAVPGSYIILVQVDATDAAGRPLEKVSAAQLLTVTAGRRPCGHAPGPVVRSMPDAVELRMVLP